MGISLPVGSHLDESEARRTSQQAKDFFSTAGREAGDEFSRYVNQGLGKVDTSKSRRDAALLERAYDKAADAAGKLRTEEAKLEAVEASGTATRAQLITHSERVEKARRAEARATREAAAAVRDMHGAGSSAVPTIDGMGSAFDGLATAGRSFAMAGAPAAILAVGGAAVTAAGALAILPAAIGGVAAGIGTLALGMHGFTDAIKDMGDTKKFAQDLQKLAPSAQQTALEIKALVDGPLGELRKATQESLFSGMAKELHDVTNTLLPSVKTATTGIAGAFNQMGHGALDQLMKPETVAALNSTLTNVTTAFQNLAPAAAPFTKAITDVMAVGSSFLPGFATSVTNAANAFAQFIDHARDTGQLSTWMHDGVDMIGKLGSIAWDVGRAFAALMPTAREVFPYVSGALHEVADLLSKNPDLIGDVVVAFAEWKAIQGVTALTGSLSAIKTALSVELPAAAGVGAAGISAALARVAVPAWLAYVVGQQNPVMNNQQVNDAVHAAANGDPSKLQNEFFNIDAEMRGQKPPSFNIPGPTPANIQARRQGLPGGAPMPAPAPGWDEFTKAPGSGLDHPWGPLTMPTVPGSGGRGGKDEFPAVPYAGDPMSLLQGMPVTSSLYGAASAVLDDQHKVAQAQSDLNKLLASNNRDEDAITRKRNELGVAQREEHEAELRLMEAKRNATNKSIGSMRSAADTMGELGVKLDADLGISKGLSGIAENIVKFVGSLAAAPLEAQLDAIKRANPSQGGSGLMGVLAAQGVFGSQFTGIAPTEPSTYPTGYPGYGGNANAAIALAQSANGGKYGFGASDLVHGLADCSGAVSDLVEVMQNGASNPGRLFNTEDFPAYAASHGWQPGLQPGTLNVGVLHGGPGGGHMAATLPNGVNFESGGSHGGIAYGGPAAGAGDRQFTEQWHLPPNSATASPPLSSLMTGSAPVTSAPAPGTLMGGQSLTDPGLTNPTPGGGGAGRFSQAAPFGLDARLAAAGLGPDVNTTPIGGLAEKSGTGKGGVGLSGGGAAGLAMQAGGLALDAMAPGAGQAAQTTIQLANRGVEFAAQAAGIGVQGLMDTFLPTGGSELAQNNWITKLVGGIAGAHPTLPNTAGKKAQPQQGASAGGQGGGNTTNNTTNINVDAQHRDSGQGIANEVAYHQEQANKLPWG